MDRHVSGWLAWVLGTWHAAFLLLAFIVGAHAAGAAGGLTAAIGTVSGILAFVWLWSVSVLVARSVLRRTEGGMEGVGGEVGMHGAAAGAVFVLGLGAVAVLTAFVQQGWDLAALSGLVFVAFAAGFAMLPGALVGWALWGIDAALWPGAGPGDEVSPAPHPRP